MKNKFLSFLCALLLGMSSPAKAEGPAPDVLIKNTVHEVMEIVNSDSGIVSNQKRLLELVDAKILPHFDFTRMTQLSVGRAWRTATAEQRQALTVEFQSMLVRTYAKVFSTYSDPKVEVKPVKLENGATEATVRTVIRIKDGTAAAVDYEMQNSPTGWKVFDVTVEGVSLVTSYRGSFADQIKQTGIDGLIKTLTDKNIDVRRAAALKQERSN